MSDVGLDAIESSRWGKLAGMPEPEFESYIATTLEDLAELTYAGIAKRIRELERPKARSDRVKRILEATKGNQVNLILCDPPWQYEHAISESRAIENQYPTMTLDGLKDKADEVGEVMAEDCVMYMWATSPKLAEAMGLLRAWKLKYRTCAVWDKEKIGMGYYFRQQHELLLVATTGEMIVPEPGNRPSSVFRSPREKHSKKPECVYKFLEQGYPEFTDKGKPQALEMFARDKRPGWWSWGNEV